jgi:hypothetical protein
MNINTYNSIIAYIIIMIYLIYVKPDFIYDYDEDKFKEIIFENKTIVLIHVISILLPIIIYMFFVFLNKNKETVIKKRRKIKYIPIQTISNNSSST